MINQPKTYLDNAKRPFRGMAFCTRCKERTEHDIASTRFGYRATCHQCGKGAPMKYNSSRTEYNGRWYDSGREAQYAAELDLRVKAGEIKSWEPQVRFDLRVNGEHICFHKVDFRVFNNDGTISLDEVKGKESEDWRLRRNLLLATVVNPDPNITYQVIR